MAGGPAYGRRLYAGGAVNTTLAADILAGATTLTVTDGSTYPASAFFIDIDHDTASAEKIYVTTRTGNTLSTLTRGADGSTGLSHTAGAVIRHVHVAQDVDEANAASAALTTKGDIMVRGASAGPTRLGVGADLSYLRANSGAGVGLEYSADPIPKTIVDVKGDLIVATGADVVARLAAGANGKSLQGASAAASGLAYDYPIALLTTAARDALAGADLWRGRTIFNTTTGALEVYYGATTLWRPPWNVPWGVVSPRTATSSTQAFTGSYANITSLSAALVVVAGRRYVAHIKLTHTVTSSGSFFVTMADTASGNQLDGAEQQDFHSLITSQPQQLSAFGIYEAAASGSLSINGQIKATGGGAGVLVQNTGTISAFLTVIDQGPTGNAPAS